VEHHEGLLIVVTSPKWRQWAPKQSYRELANEVRTLILDDTLYNQQQDILKIFDPLLKALRLGDSNTCALGEIYPLCASFKDKIHKIVDDFSLERFPEPLQRLEQMYMIIDTRWAYLYAPIHGAAYALNPRYIAQDLGTQDPEIFAGLERIVERYYHDDDDKVVRAMSQFPRFRSPAGPFRSNPTRLKAAMSKEILPWDWWSMYGGEMPELRAVAITILSTQAGIGASERAHKLLNNSKDKKSNRLSTEKSKKKVFIKQNLRILDNLANPFYTEPYPEPSSSDDDDE